MAPTLYIRIVWIVTQIFSILILILLHGLVTVFVNMAWFIFLMCQECYDIEANDSGFYAFLSLEWHHALVDNNLVSVS